MQMQAPPFCPLGDEHCAILTQVGQQCNDLACYLDKLQAAGIDVSEYQQRNNSIAQMAAALKQAHFPEAP